MVEGARLAPAVARRAAGNIAHLAARGSRAENVHRQINVRKLQLPSGWEGLVGDEKMKAVTGLMIVVVGPAGGIMLALLPGVRAEFSSDAIIGLWLELLGKIIREKIGGKTRVSRGSEILE